MSIELKVGEWYETRNGERVKAAFDARGIGLKDDHDTIIAVDRDGGRMFYHPCGGYLEPVSAGEPGPYDIVKHLPGCAGWDWVEPKWRLARPFDLEAGKPVPCRAKDREDEDWRYSDLIGFEIGDLWKFTTRKGRYSICEVRDE